MNRSMQKRLDLSRQKRRLSSADKTESALEMARKLPTVDAKTAGFILGVSADAMILAAKSGQFGSFLVGKRYRFVSRFILDAVEGAGARDVAA